MRPILALSLFAGLIACAPANTPAPAAATSAAPAAPAAAAAPTDELREALTKPPAAGEKSAYFVNLKDGQEVTSPFRVVFGLTGLGVAPAGVDKPDTGHHHLIVDMDMTPKAMEEMLPKDDHHRHFGNGQTEVVISDLPPGLHTLQLVVADKDHVPLKPAVVSAQIKIVVK